MMPHRTRTVTVGHTQAGSMPTVLPQPLSYSVEAQPDEETGTIQAVFYQHLPELSRDSLHVRRRQVLTRTIGDGDDIVATTDAFAEIVEEVEAYNQTLYAQYEDALGAIGLSSGEPTMIEAHFAHQQKSLEERNRDNTMLTSRLNTLNGA